MKAFIEQKPRVSQWESVTEDPRYNEPLYNEFLGIKKYSETSFKRTPN